MTDTVLTRDTVVVPPSRHDARLSRILTPKRLALAFAMVALLGGAAWYGNDWWSNGRFVESTDDAYVGGNITALAPHVSRCWSLTINASTPVRL
jgi:membrane fusion protein, multidrug efflux system